MAAEGAGPPGALRTSLWKCFGALREQHAAWQGTLAACAPLLRSLASLAEQSQAARRARFDGGPLRRFPALRERLGHKQRGAMEAVLGQLRQEKLARLREVRDAVAALVDAALVLGAQHARELGCGGAFRRSALQPSAADMLEWLLDLDRRFHHAYLEVKLLLSQVRYENLPEIQALPKAWEQVQQKELQAVVEDVLLKVSFLEAP